MNILHYMNQTNFIHVLNKFDNDPKSINQYELDLHLKEHKDIILLLLHNGLKIYHFLPSSFQDDRDVIKTTLQHQAVTLHKEWYTKKIRYDKELVLIVVKQFSLMYKNVSDELKNDIDIIMAAINNNGEVFSYLPEKYQHQKELSILALSNSYGNVYEQLPEKFAQDKHVIVEALKNNPLIIRELPYEMHDDKNIIYELLNINYALIEKTNSSLKNENFKPISWIGSNLLIELENNIPDYINMKNDQYKTQAIKEYLEKVFLLEKLEGQLNCSNIIDKKIKI